MISIMVLNAPVHQPWALTTIHSPCDSVAKSVFWEEVEWVGEVFGGPWLVMGDFNMVSSQHEKWGG